MEYKKLPWKKSFRKLPNKLTAAIEAVREEAFYVGASVLIGEADRDGKYGHLQLDRDETRSFLPDQTVGPVSDKNLNGWEIIRKDLPMLTKTYFWESPNFGDASTYGTHIHYRDRQVYQRQVFEPRNYEISSRPLRRNADGTTLYLFRVEQPIRKGDDTLNDELLFCANLLQENVGTVDVIGEGVSIEEFIATINLDWEVFPPGDEAETVERLTAGQRGGADKAGEVAERVRLFARLRPKAYLKGRGGMSSYVGAQYADDLVVFENINYGNALYVLYDDWQEVSQRSRIDLIKGTDSRFDRIPHTIGWEEAFRRIMRREKLKRGIRD